MFRIRLRELREAAGYRSQQAFGDAFGVAQSTVGSWEAGAREPNYETTMRLADFFGVTVDDIMGRGVEKKPATQEGDRLTQEEWDVILRYRAASTEIRDAVQRVVGDGK